MKRLISLVVVSFVFVTMMGCAEKKKVSIAVIPKGTTHIFWKSIHAGAKKAADSLNIDIIWQGPQKEDDREMQINVVQNFISRGVSAIVLAPLDEVALVRPVTSAVNRGIPVVIIDSDLHDSSYASFVATDNYAGGNLAATHLAAILGKKGNVLIMRYAEGSASTQKREQGFLDGIREYAPDIELISIDQYGGVTQESALQVGQNLLNKYDSLDGIFCPNESTTFGMLRALEIANRTDEVRFVGFDSSDPLIQALRDKKIDGLVVQNPFRMGYEGVVTAYNVINNIAVEKRVDTGVKLVTSENIDQPEIQQIIALDIEKYLQ